LNRLAAKKPKFGFFQSEKEIFQSIANHLGIKQLEKGPLVFARHPLVYLVEAADDICYQVMDIEDAHKLKIITYDETRELFLNFFDPGNDRSMLEKSIKPCAKLPTGTSRFRFCVPV
jgi:dGTPase